MPRADLLDLERVEVEDGDEARFVLHGHGFPTDRPASIRLRGVVHRPGRQPSVARVTLTGKAQTAEELSFDIDGHPELAALSPGQFEGSLEVSVEAESTWVRGRLSSVRLPLRSARRDARRDALHAARRGTQWLASLGATELEIDLDRPGVRVGKVESEGGAGLSGLAPGDRIVALDGATVGDLADLWPAPGARPVRLRVERGAASRQVEISLPRAHGQRLRAAPDERWLGTLLLLWVGALLLLPSRLTAPPAPLAISWLGGALLACGIVALGFALQLGTAQMHVLRGVLPAALAVALGPLWARRPDRLERWARTGAQLAVAFVALATAGLLCGTLSPSLDVGAGLGDWPLLLQPPGWCLLVMVHVALRTTAVGTAPRAVAAGARGVMTVALSALLGGAQLWPEAGAVTGIALVGSLLWAALEWVVARRVFPLAVLAAGSLLGPAIGLVWFLGAPSQLVAATFSALSPWLLGALCVRALVVRSRARLWPAPRFDPQLAPFL